MMSPSKSKSNSSSKSRSKTTPNSNALALIPLENITDHDSPVPLTVFYPKISEEICLRRSPRLNPSTFRSCNQNVVKKGSKRRFSDPNLSIRSCLRRSPRLNSDSAVEIEEISGNLQKSRVMLLNSNSLRRSPRFSGNVELELSRKIMSKRRKRSSAEKSETETPDAKFLKRCSRFDLKNGDEVKCGVNQGGKATGQCSTYIVGEDEVVKNVEGMEPKISFKKLESPKRGNFDALPSTLSNDEMDLSIKLDVEQLSFSQHEEIHGPTVSLGSETSNLKVKLAYNIAAEPSPVSSCANQDEEPTLFCCNSYFSDKKLLRAENSITSHASSLELDLKHPPEQISNACVVNKKKKSKMDSFFIGDPVPADEAQQRWKWRYEMKSQILKGQRMTENGGDDEDMVVVNVDCHYIQANVANSIFSLGDCVYIKGEEEKDLVGRIVEFFKTTDGDNYFRAQWFYRVEDTVIQQEGAFHDKRRLFYSTIMNDNPIDCIVSKVNVTQIKPRVGLKQNTASSFDYYYDMEYCVEYSTFRTLTNDQPLENVTVPTNSTETSHVMSSINPLENNPKKSDLVLLDLYSGCGGMSTGLCLGAKHSSVNLVTRWAVDSHKSACESLKLNHPETHVRNESAEDFLELLKQWEKLCRRYKTDDVERTRSKLSNSKLKSLDDKIPSDEHEVSSLVDICYSDPDGTGKRGLKFLVHWKGYGSSEDTWEPVEGLSNCQEAIKDFVRRGLKSNYLPLPGDVDVICGGPPCQGISGYNRFRNIDSPMDDERNRQIVIFMDIVKFLRPKFVLMENVTDILRFDKASLGRYALSRLVHMNYQARLGTIAAGCYGLPQFRLRVFLWGAQPSEKLPQFPLPTHEVIVRYWPPMEFERNTVAYDEEQPRKLEKAALIQDAISDLPAVLNSESREELPYEKPPETEFQRYIRSSQYEMIGNELNGTTMTKDLLYDHRSYLLHEDDYLRVCNIPKRKGANFRDLPGVVVGNDNVARRDIKSEVLLPSGKPMVPDYAFTFEQGKSRRPFGRLWWDETVPTVVTFPSCHNQVALHPEQDRILTIREYARLQGFPDYYRFCGTVKERYCQVGNAVAVSVSRALGYCLGLAFRRIGGNEPLLVLPPKFSLSNYIQFQKQLSSPEETEKTEDSSLPIDFLSSPDV